MLTATIVVGVVMFLLLVAAKTYRSAALGADRASQELLELYKPNRVCECGREFNSKSPQSTCLACFIKEHTHS